ncbi:spore germination protein [Metabacillus fastidiosus]|uniref:spore germination protein n=1 Tax=Metabacillus fastidiosus TaxID=1458 RepID=UPI002E208F10|nr:spore germination protein [Metabacillus fastidiosus]
MPSFVGSVDINHIQPGMFSVGDAFILTPKSVQKSSFGAGSISIGDFKNTKTIFNISNFFDSDLIDQYK